MKSQKEFRRIQRRQDKYKTDNVDALGLDNPAQSFIVCQIALETDDLETNIYKFKLQYHFRVTKQKVKGLEIEDTNLNDLIMDVRHE